MRYPARRLYAMALYATRPTGAAAAHAPEYEVALRVALVVATDEEDARAKGMSELTELCPEEQGWTNHHVAFSAVAKDELRAVLEVIDEDLREPVEGDDTAELLM